MDSADSDQALLQAVEDAHAAVRRAQALAYSHDASGRWVAGFWAARSLNSCQSKLIRLILRYQRKGHWH